jgi:RNA polymerase sigma-70 factor (ECF subfamily)
MTLPNPEFEAECIRRILAGEKHLFHDLIRPCERSIYFLLLSLLKNETDAEDAAQETVIKVYQNLDKFRGDAQFRTWVLSIARNEGLGKLRKIGSRREDSLDAETDESSGDYTPAILTSWKEIPAEALEQKELGAILRQAIEGLPEIYRNIVLLRDIEEMDIRQTAAVLGISEASVKVRLHRARALLQRHLAPQLKGYAPKRKGWFGGHISAYIDGEVDASLRADIDRHLETCEICSAVLDSTRNVVILVADDRVFELPAGFSERLHARIDRELEAPGG